MRIFIATVTVILGVLTGLYHAIKLKAREEILREIVLMLEEASIHIRYRALPVDELLRQLDRFEFIKHVLAYMEEKDNHDWRYAWEKATYELLGLNRDDGKLLISVGKSLGNSDITGQLAMLEMNRNFFSARLSEASADIDKKVKMYRSVGLLAGLGTAIMIL